jgi:transcriptional regulator with XRE-family HTH domain
MPNERTERQIVKPKHLAAKLRALRDHLGVSQTGMQRLLKHKGFYTRISEYERGKRAPSVMTLLAYSLLAKITINDLVDDEIDLDRFRDALVMKKTGSR